MASRHSRRDFFRLAGSAGAAAAGTAAGWASASGDPAPDGPPHLASVFGQPAAVPKPRGERVVVVGGGWSGLSLAKYLKRAKPDFDVVLIERRRTFVSSPVSNTFYSGVVDWEFLCHSFHDAARANDYVYFNATVVDVDRDSRRVFTEQGYLDYEWLVLAPGIEYDYAGIGVTDPGVEQTLRDHFPAGFLPGSSDLTIKGKVAAFAGGTFLLTVPSGNYRCLPAPYERACMIADAFQARGVKGRVLLLDPNPEPATKSEGFLGAFNELYPDTIEYVPSTEITGLDPHNRQVETRFGGHGFDDGAIYPPIRGGPLLETLGLTKPGSQQEADIDPLKYNVIGDPRVYVTGDARSMPLAKAGSAANSEARYVAELIAARSRGEELEWRSPETVCYSMVSADPDRAILIRNRYSYRLAGDRYEWSLADTHLDQEWDQEKGQATLEWARAMYRDLFTAA